MAMQILNNDEDTRLSSLLQMVAKEHAENISTDELSLLITCFVPSKPSSVRSKGYLVLSAICERLRNSRQPGGDGEDDPDTNAILQKFSPEIVKRLSDVEELPLLEALSFIGALFGVDWRSAECIFRRDVFQEAMMDALELFPSSKYLPRVIASLLAQASGYKGCRTSFSSRCSSWLESISRQTDDPEVRESVALAQVKWSQGGTADSDIASGSGSNTSSKRQRDLFKTMRGLILDTKSSLSSAPSAIEGLAYLSAVPTIKEMITQDIALLSKFVSFRPASRISTSSSEEETPGTVLYGLSIIICNLCAYRPRLTEEELRIEKLRHMAAAGSTKSAGQNSGSDDSLDDDERVRTRGKQLVKVGAVDLLVAIVRASDSRATRGAVARAMLSLVEDKDNRGKILQAGGAKALMTIIRASSRTAPAGTSDKPGTSTLDQQDLIPIQALAKLAITSSPLQVFGPNDAIVYDAVNPFATLLLHSSSALLQRFEAMMALTNLASNTESATRIAKASGVMNKVEFLLLNDNVMIRRAATELLCNLVAGSEEAFDKCSGEAGGEGSEGRGSAKSRLQILVALSDVEDEATRLAASGALATLTASSTACQLLLSLELERHRVLPILKQLIEPSADDENPTSHPNLNPGLVHRGVVCVRNLLANMADDSSRRQLAAEIEKTEIVPSLVGVLRAAAAKNDGDPVAQPVAEALKLLLSSGISITG